MYGNRLGISIALAVILHIVAALILSNLPEQPRLQRPVTVEMRVIDPPKPPDQPPPEPEKPKEPEKIEPTPTEQPKPLEMLKVQPQAMHVSARADKTHDTPRSERAVTTGDSTDTPTFGFSLESTSESGKGPAMPVGNTLQAPSGGPREDKPKALAAPVAARDVTKDPLPKGDCHGQYTEAARDAGIEGLVVLSVVVDAEGNARDIHLVEKLGHGLDEAAIVALKACKFSPGEHNGQAVAVRIPRFKLRFLLANSGE
jgi:TonB family protein